MPTPPVPPARGNFLPVAIIGALFFVFGFVTWLNGALIPFLKLACELQTNGQALLVTSVFYISYFVLALPASWILGRSGFKAGMSLGLAIMAVGALVFVPAAINRSFGLFLTGLFVQGLGLALLQTASNPYISVVGPIESAARRISIMGICNKMAGALSPLILSAIVLKGAGEIEARLATTHGPDRVALLEELSHRVIAPYEIMAAVLLLLAALILISPLPEVENSVNADSPTDRTSIFQFPHLLLGVLCIFVYVGVEVMAGDVIVLHAQAMGMELDRTKNLTFWTMIAMLAGYVAGIFAIPRWVSQKTALLISAVLGVIFATASFLTAGTASIVFIVLLGLANALMWPAIFPLAIDGLGRFTRTGAALLIMGVAGGAIIPQIFAWLAPRIGQQSAFLWCTAPAYLYILSYALRGCRAGRNPS